MITSETFYRAECDALGCIRTMPDEDADASHWPHETVIEQMAEPQGDHDETWTVVGDLTFCPRHAPGNTECAACDGRGYFRTEHPDPEPGTGKWRFTDCPICGDRGYLVPEHEIGGAE
jgi:hypothetical protein